MSEQPDFRIRAYERHAANLVRDLRDLADRVERESRPARNAGVAGTPRYLAAAEAVNHAIAWGVANAGPHRLFDVAYHADQAEAELGTDE